MTLEARDKRRDVHVPADQISTFQSVATPEEAVERLIALHDSAIEAQRHALEHFFATGTRSYAPRTIPLPLSGTASRLSLDLRAAGEAAGLCQVPGAGRLCHDHHPAGLLPDLSAGAAELPRARLRRDHRGRRQRSGNPLSLRVRAGRRARPRRPFRIRTRAAFPDPASRQGRRRDRRRHLGVPRERAAAAGALRCGAGRLFPAPPRALHRQRLALRPALDPAHQLSPLCGPVHPLGGEGAGERGRALYAGSSCPAASPSSAGWTRPSSRS